jgi:hypothetical protein
MTIGVYPSSGAAVCTDCCHERVRIERLDDKTLYKVRVIFITVQCMLLYFLFVLT